MEWRDLTFTLGDKELLSGVSGILEPGHVTGVLGFSGAGKSTLLNILSGRQRTSGVSRTSGGRKRVELTGEVSVGGRVAKPLQVRSSVAYVFQESSLPETETPRELLTFSAYLRLPREVSAKARAAKVGEVLEQLNLQGCADTVVGSVLKGGLSGGERKRTTVGVELIWGPRMVFLDEPLSGLDAFNAFALSRSLRELSRTGVGVLMTLHQPSSQIFEELDDILVLDKGSAIYCGPARRLEAHFESLGLVCPPRCNPADFIVISVLGQPPQEVQRVKDAWPTSVLHQELMRRISAAEVAQADCTSSEESGSSEEEVVAERPRRSCFQAIAALLGRDMRRFWRDGRAQLVAAVSTVAVALAYGFLFVNVGRQDLDPRWEPNCRDSSFDAIRCSTFVRRHYASLSMIVVNTLMISIQTATSTLHVERHVYLRERAGGYYTTLPYFLVKTIMELPNAALVSFLVLLAMYWVVGLQANILWLMLENLMLGMGSASLIYVFSVLAETSEQSTAYVLIPHISQLLFSGLLVDLAQVPAGIRWLRWGMPVYHSVQALLATEFSDVFDAADACFAAGGACPAAGECPSGKRCPCPGTCARLEVLQMMDLQQGRLWPSVLACLGLTVLYRGLAVVALSRRSRFVH